MENHCWLFKRFLFIYIFTSNVSKNRINQPYAKKLGGLIVIDDKVVNEIIYDVIR